MSIPVSRSSIDRMAIYRDLRVPEVWRYSEKGLRIARLNEDGEYETCLSSPTIPALQVGELERFLREGAGQPTSKVVREFRNRNRSRA